MDKDKTVKIVPVTVIKVRGKLPGNKAEIFNGHYADDWTCAKGVNEEMELGPGRGKIFNSIPLKNCVIYDRHGRIRDLCRHFEGVWDPVYRDEHRKTSQKYIQCSCKSKVSSSDLDKHRWELYELMTDTFK
jgi:hypothetical protein